MERRSRSGLHRTAASRVPAEPVPMVNDEAHQTVVVTVHRSSNADVSAKTDYQTADEVAVQTTNQKPVALVERLVDDVRSDDQNKINETLSARRTLGDGSCAPLSDQAPSVRDQFHEALIVNAKMSEELNAQRRQVELLTTRLKEYEVEMMLTCYL